MWRDFFLYDHTIDVILQPKPWRLPALPPKGHLRRSYWDLEQAKLKKGRQASGIAGEVTLVHRAASGKAGRGGGSRERRGGGGLDLDAKIESLHAAPISRIALRRDRTMRKWGSRSAAQFAPSAGLDAGAESGHSFRGRSRRPSHLTNGASR